MLEINSWISNAPGCTQYRHTASPKCLQRTLSERGWRSGSKRLLGIVVPAAKDMFCIKASPLTQEPVAFQLSLNPLSVLSLLSGMIFEGTWSCGFSSPEGLVQTDKNMMIQTEKVIKKKEDDFAPDCLNKSTQLLHLLWCVYVNLQHPV